MCIDSLDCLVTLPEIHRWRRRLRGTGFASNRVVGVEGAEAVMSNENESPVYVSNWTLATGMRPGERPITDPDMRSSGEGPITDTESAASGRAADQ
jgi:hypothetical protein